jgi:hypothetical protein
LRLHQLRHQDWAGVSCVVQLNLIVWWLQEEEAQWMRELLTGVLEPLAGDIADLGEHEASQGKPPAQEGLLSSWTLAHFCCEQVRTMLRGAWSRKRTQQCQPALLRYVRSRKRLRGHRESEQRVWLQSRCPQQAGAVGA